MLALSTSIKAGASNGAWRLVIIIEKVNQDGLRDLTVDHIVRWVELAKHSSVAPRAMMAISETFEGREGFARR